MQLLDSCPQPQVQFASLSVLLQLHLNHNDTTSNNNVDNYSPLNNEQCDTPSDNNEADKSGGPSLKSTKFIPRYGILKEHISLITPTTLLSKDTTNECIDNLELKVCQEFGLRDDFTAGLNGSGRDKENGEERDDKEFYLGGETFDNDSPTKRRSSSVRFSDGTKQPSPTNTASSSINNLTCGTLSSFGSQLSVQTYKPSNLNSSFGITLFYIAVNVHDYMTNNNNGDDVKTLHSCIKVLLPDISLTELNKSGDLGGSQQQQGIILLTVGIKGPAYDIFGNSSVISNLPMRLRECILIFSKVDTSPREVILTVQQEGKEVEQQPTSGSPRKKMFGKSTQSVSTVQPQPQQQKQQRVSYDSDYFHRLYMALLANLIDDDGLLQDHDGIISSSTSAAVEQVANRPLTESTTGLLANQSITSSGTIKKKRFTFSRSKKGSSSKNTQSEYESGEMISGGDDDPFFADKANVAMSEENRGGMNNAEIVRRTAQQLEVLSLVEDDMALPKYTHYNEKSKVPSSPRGLASPRGRKSGVTAGRFGRLPVPSDLAGFEYRPHIHGSGGMSISGTASTAMGSISDDMSTATGGDDTATVNSKYTVNTFSSGLSTLSAVPTLSKSKRDSTGSKSSRSRFMRKKKKKSSIGGSPTKSISEDSPSKLPPLAPISTTPQEVYDPFSIDENYAEIEEETAPPSPAINETAPPSPAINDLSSIASVSTKDTEQTPTTPLQDQDEAQASSTPAIQENVETQSPVTPQEVVEESQPTPQRIEPQLQVITARSRSFSDDEVTAEGQQLDLALQPQEEEPATIQEAEPAMMEEPLKYLDVNLALNEDLSCEYKRSKLSSLSVEGTLQVRVNTSYKDGGKHQQEQEQSPVPFSLVFQDHSGHIKALQENKKFVENVSHEEDVARREFNYTIKVPREEEYFPVVRYKCGSSLRPVPIRVQSRVRTQGKFCRVALQISSNPTNQSDLVHLTIIMSVPEGVRGSSVQCNPPGGVWNETKRVVLWCVSELAGGEKFQLQSIFEVEDELLNSGEDLTSKLEFPVLTRCQCTGAQLSDVGLEVMAMSQSVLPAKNIIRRFRVAHTESNK